MKKTEPLGSIIENRISSVDSYSIGKPEIKIVCTLYNGNRAYCRKVIPVIFYQSLYDLSWDNHSDVSDMKASLGYHKVQRVEYFFERDLVFETLKGGILNKLKNITGHVVPKANKKL